MNPLHISLQIHDESEMIRASVPRTTSERNLILPRMTTGQMMEVITAAAAGKTIEVTRRSGPADWRVATDPRFNFMDFNYRVQPEPPRVLFVRIDNYGHVTHASVNESAINLAMNQCYGGRKVRFVEASA